MFRQKADLSHLQYSAVVGLGEDELLLVERVEGASYDRRLLLLNTVLAVHQVDLDVRRWNESEGS